MMDAVHPNAEISERLHRIYSLHNKVMDFRLEDSPYLKLLEKLGNPQLKLPPVIHLAGTNGKGSSSAFLFHALREAGYKVHCYHSPHLRVFNERITLAGELISDDELLNALKRVNAINGDSPLTFFEYTTAMAFDLFARHEADIFLLETGLGGRLDCSNVVPNPLACMITKIGFDHMQFLGNSLPEIAGEKAGIIKDNVPVFVAEQDNPDEVLPVFENKAQECGAEMIKAGVLPDDYVLGLTGKHQYENAGLAYAVLTFLNERGFEITQAHIRSGFEKTCWAGRLQPIEQGWLYDALPQGGKLWYDGGHNESAAKVLAAQVQHWKNTEDEDVDMILAMQSDKDPNVFLNAFDGCIDRIHVMDVEGGMHPQKGEDLLAKMNDFWRSRSCMFSKDALAPRTYLVCGSLFLYQDIN